MVSSHKGLVMRSFAVFVKLDWTRLLCDDCIFRWLSGCPNMYFKLSLICNICNTYQIWNIFIYVITCSSNADNAANRLFHYSDVIMSAMASQITGISIVFSTICSGSDQRKQQSLASLDIVRGVHRWQVDFPSQDRWISPHKGPVTRKMLPFDDVIMWSSWHGVLTFWLRSALHIE